MKKRPSLVVLDVGHGNAAVLVDRGGVVVIDSGKGGVLIDFLRAQRIKEVELMLISHADTDHIRNAPDLLLDKDIIVKRICFNSDATQQSQAWRHFRYAIGYARREKGLVAEPQLTTSQTGRLNCGDVHIEVLYPDPEIAGSGPGGKTPGGAALTSNSMSAVIRLSTDKGKTRMVLLAGDVERGCLEAWEKEGVDPTAPVLIFPHHGGQPGRDDAADFAVALTRAVNPKTVIFSIHRSQYNLPIPEVVETIRGTAHDVRVACTQLSAHCTSVLPTAAPAHLTEHVAQGRWSNSCCAGTIVIDLTGNQPVLSPPATQHMAFIERLGGTHLCTR